jgi:hypothetical protein
MENKTPTAAAGPQFAEGFTIVTPQEQTPITPTADEVAASAAPSDQAPATPAEQAPLEQAPSEQDLAASQESSAPAEQVPAFDYSRFGVKDEVELAETLAKAREAINSLSEFDKIKDRIKNPFANERIAQINNVVSQLGVSEDIAAKLVSTTTESLQKDPVEALTLKMIIDNPAALGIMSVSDIRQAVIQKYNIEEEDGVHVLSPIAKLELAGALKEIQNKVESSRQTTTDIYASLQQQVQAETASYQSRLEKAAADVDRAVSQFSTLNVEVNGRKLSVAVSPDSLKSVKEYASRFAANIPENEGYQATLNQYIQSSLEAKYRNELFKAYHEKVEGELREEAIKKSHNGGPVIHKDNPANTSTPADAPHIAAAKRMMEKYGVTVPNS